MADLMQQARELLARAYDEIGEPICADMTRSGRHEHRAAMRAIAAALRTAPEWQPIETAPKDSRWLMLGISGRNEIMLGYWSRLHGAWWGQTCAHGEFQLWQRATHWMPMPAAPLAVRPQEQVNG